MSKFESMAIILVGALVFGLLYGMFVFNHQQNVQRDKYLIERCEAVNAKPNSLFTDGKDYTCINPAPTSENQ